MLGSGTAAFLLAHAVPALAYAQQTAAVPSLVFDGVTVIDVVHGKRLPAQRVVVVGNRIQAVGSAHAVPVPKGAQVEDARGKYLIPGLWDMHVHHKHLLSQLDQSAAPPPHLMHRAFLANGVTGIRDAGSPLPLDTLIRWRQAILDGTRVGPPRQIFSGQSIAGGPGTRGNKGGSSVCDKKYWRYEAQTCVTDSADARHYVDSLHAAGADMIKPRDVTKELYFVIAAEARRRGIPFGGHTFTLTAIEASDSGATIVDHSILRLFCSAKSPSTSVERCQSAAEHLRRNGTWVVPTLTFSLLGGGGSGYRLVGGYFRKRIGEFLAGAPLTGNWLRDSAGSKLAHAASLGSSSGSLDLMPYIQGVDLPIVAGTDDMLAAQWGFSLHAELAMYVAEGLTPLNALQSATLNPAKLLRATDSLGTVAPGKLADLVLLDADPLTDITNTTMIRAVVANGRYYDRAALDRLLAEVQAKATFTSRSSMHAP